MAKVFGGFTPEQMGKIIPEMQGMQTDEQAKFLASNPSAASRVGKMAEQASKRISMATGGYVQGYQIGGLANQAVQGLAGSMPELAQGNVEPFNKAINQDNSNFIMPMPGIPTPVPPYDPNRPPPPKLIEEPVTPPSQVGDFKIELDNAQLEYANAEKTASEAMAKSQANPSNSDLAKAAETAQAAVNAAQTKMNAADKSFKTIAAPSITEYTTKATNDPSSMLQKTDIEKIAEADKQEGMIDPATGQVKPVAEAMATTATPSADATSPEVQPATSYDPLEASASIEDVMSRLEAATGKPSEAALVDAQSMKPEDLAQLGVSVEQIKEAQKIIAPDARKLEDGELIAGSTVDMDRVKKETNFEAATGAPSSDATVQGQLTGLMEQFEGKTPPAWAAGAMRNAAASMATRGLGSSSMAGQAMIQAAMESAMPIAVQDSQTSAKFELTNLSNRQQTAMFAAEQRAEFLGLEFNQNFQTRVANSAKISEIANINFNAEQQIALENARMAQTVDLTNLSAKNAKIMADVAAMSQLDLTNLNNRQQAQVQNAKSFLEMDMTNLDNLQQVSVFKSQQNANAILSDQAAVNASKQFNATSQSQTDQFFASLQSQVAQFNVAQQNAMAQFNAGEENAISQFNTLQRNQRDQFNAQNHLVIAQANAQWSQSITTTENAMANQANREKTLADNNMTMTTYNNMLQKERDLMTWAWTSAESAMDREASIMVAKIDAEGEAGAGDSGSSTTSKLIGKIGEKIIGNLIDSW
jgi:hypothetical protein